jgi:hypothetical protein
MIQEDGGEVMMIAHTPGLDVVRWTIKINHQQQQ